jgi:DDE superfamily endonuclease
LKNCSSKTIKRILKRNNLSWKRMRNSLKDKRDQVLFDFFKIDISYLQDMATKGEIDLLFWDESGFSLKPNSLYCWQEKGKTLSLPANRTQRFTVQGLLNVHTQEFYGCVYNGSANAQTTIQVLDKLSQNLSRKTIIIIDNASTHNIILILSKKCNPIWQR